MGTIVALGGFIAGSFLGGSVATALGATALVASAVSMVTGTLVATWLGGAISPSQSSVSEIESDRKFQDLKYASFQQNGTVPLAHGVVYTSGTVIMIGKNHAELRQVGERKYEVQSGKDGNETRSQAVKQPFYQLDSMLALCEGPIESVIQLNFQDFDVTHLEGDIGTGWLLFRGEEDESIETEHPDFWARMQSVIDDTVPFRSTAKIGWYGDIGSANSIPRITAVIRGRRSTYDTGINAVSYTKNPSDTWYHYDPDLEDIVSVDGDDQGSVISFNRIGGSMTTTIPPGGINILFGASWGWKDKFVVYEDSASGRQVFVGRKGFTSSSAWTSSTSEDSDFDLNILGFTMDIHHGIIYTLHENAPDELYVFACDIENDTFTKFDLSDSLTDSGFDESIVFSEDSYVGMCYDHENDHLYIGLYYYDAEYIISVIKVDVSETSNFYTVYLHSGLRASAPKGLSKSGDTFITLDTSPSVSSAVAGDSLEWEVDFTSTVVNWGEVLAMPTGWHTYRFASNTADSGGFVVSQDSSDILYSTTARSLPNRSCLSVFVGDDVGYDVETFTDWDDLLSRNSEYPLLSIVKYLPEETQWIKTSHNGREGWTHYSYDNFGAVPFASNNQKVTGIVSIEAPYENNNVSVGLALRATYGDTLEYYYAIVTRQGSEDSGGLLFEVGYFYAGEKHIIEATDATDYVYNMITYKQRQPMMLKVEVENETTDRLKLWYGTSEETDDPIINTTISGSIVTALRATEGTVATTNAYAGIISTSISYRPDGATEDSFSYGRIFSVSFYNIDMEVPSHYLLERFSLSDNYQPTPATCPIYDGDPRLLDDAVEGRYWRQTATYGAKRDWHNRSTFDVVSLTAPSMMISDPWTGYMFIRDTVDTDWVFVYTRWNREDWSYTSKTEWRQRIFTSLHSGPGWIFDILTNTTFGCGIDLRDPHVSIDIASFEESEGHCLEQVLVAGDDGEYDYEDRYQIDGIIDNRSNGISHVQKIASNFNAYISEAGTIRLNQIRPMRRISRHFDVASIKFDGDESTITRSIDDVFSRPNEIVTEYRDSEEDFRFFPAREIDEYAQEWYGIPQSPYRNIRNVVREFVNRKSQNIRMNRYDLNASSMLDTKISFVTDMRASDLSVGSFITVTYSTLGYEEQLMQISDIEESLDSEGGIEYVLECVPFTNDLFNVADSDFVISTPTKIERTGEVFPPGMFVCAHDLYANRYIFCFGNTIDGAQLAAVSLQKKQGTVALNTVNGFAFQSIANSYLTPCGLVHSMMTDTDGNKILVLMNSNGSLSPLQGQLFIRRWFDNYDTTMIEYALSPVEYGAIDEVSLVDLPEFAAPQVNMNQRNIEGLNSPALLFLKNIRDPSRGTYYNGLRLVGEGPNSLTVENYLAQDYELWVHDGDPQFEKSHQFSVAYARTRSGWKTIAYRRYDANNIPQFETTNGAAWFTADDPWEIDIASDRPFNFIEIVPNLNMYIYGAAQDYSLSGEPIKMEIDRIYFWDGEEEKWKRCWNVVDGTSGMRLNYFDGEYHYGTGVSFALPYWPIRPFYSDVIVNESTRPVMYYRLEEDTASTGNVVFASSVASDRYASENAHDLIGFTSKSNGGLTYYSQPFRTVSSRIGEIPFLNSSRHVPGDLVYENNYHAGGGYGTFVVPISTNAMNRCPLYSRSRSIECWFKIDSDTPVTHHGLWGYGGLNQDQSESFISSSGKYFSCYYYNNHVIVDCGHSQADPEDWSIVSTDDTKFDSTGWNHLVVTLSLGYRIDIYANGYWIGGGDLPGNLATIVSTKGYDGNDFGVSNLGSRFIIGATMPIDDLRLDTPGDQPDMFGAGYYQYVLDGSIDEVAVYDYALSSSQILNHYLCGAGLYLNGGGPWGRISSGDFIYAASGASSSPLDTSYSTLPQLQASGITSGAVNLATRKSYIYIDGDWRDYEPDYDYTDPEDYIKWPSWVRPDGDHDDDWGAYVVRVILKKPASIADDAVFQNGFIRTSLRPEFVVFNNLNEIPIDNGYQIPFEGESFACQSYGGGQILQDFRLSPKYYVPYAASIESGSRASASYFEAVTDIDAFVAVGINSDGQLVSANGDYDNFVPAIGILLKPVYGNRWNLASIAYNGEIIHNADWAWAISEGSQGFVPIYLDTNISGYTSSGNLTQIKPTGKLVQQIGVAIGPNILVVKVELGYSHGHVFGEELTGTIDGVNTEFTTQHPFISGTARVYWAVNDSGGLRVIQDLDAYGFTEYENSTILMSSPPFYGYNDYSELESQKLYIDYEIDYSAGQLTL